MSDIIAYMLGQRDFGEELTSFQNDDVEDEKDEHDEDDDDIIDIDDDMYMLYDDEPPSYDIIARLKEVNDALKKEIIPPGYEDRDRKVTFRDEPIYMEIFTYTGYTDDEEDNEENVDDDDGYGDSTEASDEPLEEPGAVNNVVEDRVEKVDEDEKVEIENLSVSHEEDCEENSVINDVANQVETDVSVVLAPEEDTGQPIETSTNDPVVECSSETVDIVTENEVVDAPETNNSLSSDENQSFDNIKDDKKDVISLTKVSKLNSIPSRERSAKLRHRSSSVPPQSNITKESNSMIMASKGKFHIMTTDDIQVRRTSSRSPRTNFPERKFPVKATINNKSADVISTSGKKQNVIPNIDSKTVKLNARNIRPATTEGKMKITPSTKETSSPTKPMNAMPKYAGGGPSGYGLTKEQKMEKKIMAKSMIQSQEEKKQDTLAEKAKKREQKEEAYKLWLQRKKLTNSNVQQKNTINQEQNENDKVVQHKTLSGPGFDAWILMKKRQKRKELEIERMKRKVEMEVCYVKAAEQNKMELNRWSKQKKSVERFS